MVGEFDPQLPTGHVGSMDEVVTQNKEARLGIKVSRPAIDGPSLHTPAGEGRCLFNTTTQLSKFSTNRRVKVFR